LVSACSSVHFHGPYQENCIEELNVAANARNRDSAKNLIMKANAVTISYDLFVTVPYK
jgi:hypothetical protein